MLDIYLNQLAYCKMVLHLAKYPHLSCNGILLAKKTKSQANVYIVDVVPLFHSSLTLAPPFEIAMNQIDSHCQANGLEIVGHYHSTENLSDNQPNIVTHKIAEKLKENSQQAYVLMINNIKVNPLNKEPCYKVYSFVDQKMKDISCNNRVDQSTYETCIRLMNDKKYNILNDFDNHLDDISLDWRNPDLNKLIPNDFNTGADVEVVANQRDD